MKYLATLGLTSVIFLIGGCGSPTTSSMTADQSEIELDQLYAQISGNKDFQNIASNARLDAEVALLRSEALSKLPVA